jgi:hypothetical protein
LSSAVIGLFTSVPVSGFAQDGIAHILGLEVLRHGTSWSNTVSILGQGALASKGGSAGGATSHLVGVENASELNEGYVHVMRDSEFGAPVGSQNRTLYHAFLKRANTKGYTMLSALSNVEDLWIIGLGNRLKMLSVKLAKIILHTPCPTLRFMYKQEEIPQIFEADPLHGHGAYRTTEDIPADRIGIVGAFRHGCDGKILERIKKDPVKAALGVAELVAGVALTVFGLGFFI